jgi:hypothetical protein
MDSNRFSHLQTAVPMAYEIQQPKAPAGMDPNGARVWDLFNIPGITGFTANAITRDALVLARDGFTATSGTKLGFAFDFNAAAPADATSFQPVANWAAVEDGLVTSHSIAVSAVRDLLAAESFDDMERVILSDRKAYTALMRRAIALVTAGQAVSPAPNAIKFHLMQLLVDASNRIISEAVLRYFAEQHINADPSIQATVIDRLKVSGLSVQDPFGSIGAVYQMVRELGNLPFLVDGWLNRGEVLPDRVTDAIKNEMVNFLRTLNLNTALIQTETNSSGLVVLKDCGFDEYFAGAYQHALRVNSGQEDPIFQVYNPNYNSAWNLNVDYFDDVEEQSIVPEHIRAAGALYYCYMMGEVMGLYHVVDYLTLMWARGSLALSQGEASTKLYRYYKRRDDRMTSEERAMTWKQVLNLGDAPTLQNVVSNNEFSSLFDSLLREVVEFMTKTENFDSGSGNVSSESIYISVHAMQGNLSAYMVGKPLADVHELYAQLKDCLDILKCDEIRDQLGGGRNKNIWTVISRVLRDHLHRQINVSAAKAAAVEVHKLFDFIARFDYSRRHYAVLRDFLRSTEAFILAQEQLSGAFPSHNPASHDTPVGNGGSKGGDFDDWD